MYFYSWFTFFIHKVNFATQQPFTQHSPFFFAGHYLAVSTTHGDENSTAIVSFSLKNTGGEQDMHVVLFTRILNHLKDGSSE
jgi:hypothetical protein